MPFIEEQTGRPDDGRTTVPPSVTFAPNPRHVSWEFFQSIGEAIWTLLAALAGGGVARWVYRSEQARSTAAS